MTLKDRQPLASPVCIHCCPRGPRIYNLVLLVVPSSASHGFLGNARMLSRHLVSQYDLPLLASTSQHHRAYDSVLLPRQYPDIVVSQCQNAEPFIFFRSVMTHLHPPSLYAKHRRFLRNLDIRHTHCRTLSAGLPSEAANRPPSFVLGQLPWGTMGYPGVQ